MRRLAAAGIALVVLSAAAPAYAGAWTRPQWGFFLRLSSKYYEADQIFESDGSRSRGDWWDDDASFRELDFNLVAELGFLDQLTGLLETSARLMHSDYTGGTGGAVRVAGLSDVVLGLRYGPYQRNLVVAAEGRVAIPTGYPRDEDRVRLGNGYVNGELRALFGGGLPIPIGNYFDTYFGYRLRGGPYSDDLVAAASFGIEPYERLWLRAGFSGTFNMGDPTAGTAGNQDASYVGVGGALTYVSRTGLGLEVAASGDVWGRNTFAGWGVEVVVQYER